MRNLDIRADADSKGMWSGVAQWPIVGIHAALMPTGTVLTFGSPTGEGVQGGRTFDIWDPAKGLSEDSHFTFPNADMIDSFCGTAAFMTSGAMLISGGGSLDYGKPTDNVTFDPATNAPFATTGEPGAFAKAQSLNEPRWYGTMITLADGRQLMVGGGTKYVSGLDDPEGVVKRRELALTPEVYTPDTGWQLLKGAKSRDAFGPENNKWWYPRLWVDPRGDVFGISADRMWGLSTEGRGSIVTYGPFKKGYTNSKTDTPNTGPTSTAVMYDIGRILQVGGNGPDNGTDTTSSASATVIDINGDKPFLIEQAHMLNRRQWANATVLPNGEVLVNGGSTMGDNDGVHNVLSAEAWIPSTGAWRARAKASVYRGYHSSAILLPNGTILTVGGGVPGPVDNFNAEIFYPPYLFKKQNGAVQLAARPQLLSVSSLKLDYDARMSLTLSTGDKISKVSVVGIGSTTHSFNTSQRFIPVNFTQRDNVVQAKMPDAASVAPPGYYMVFLVNDAGVPSRGVIISLGGAASVPASPPRLAIGDKISFQATNLDGERIRHRRLLMDVTKVSRSSKTDRNSSAFYVRPGLWNNNCYSFESVDKPGYFVRHQEFRLRLDEVDDSKIGKIDATFCTRAALNGDLDSRSLSLEPLAWRGYTVTHRNYQLWLEPRDKDAGYKWDASFRLVPPL